MEILYLSSYPKKYFKELLRYNSKSSSLPAQKFNSLLVSGFINNDIKVTVLSTFNHLKWNNKSRLVKSEMINEDGIEYFFLSMVKIGVIGRVFTNIAIKKFIENWFEEHKEGIIVIDILKPYSHIVSKYCKGSSIVSIVTDLPEHILESRSIVSKISNRIKMRNYRMLLNNSTHFVFLTKEMNTKLNINNKPNCIIEGLVDSNMTSKIMSYKLNENKVCIYTGALHRKYGVENLVKAFMMDELKEYELHLYGSGDYEEELYTITKEHYNIKYFGVVENDIVVEKQMQATILINPRPSDEDFTKYSFPSKNMEYMVTGRPVLTTYLQGMPSEYLDYVYIIDDESPKGIANKVVEILEKDIEVLTLKGACARTFVLNKKNNTIQTRKIIGMLRNENEDDKNENFMVNECFVTRSN